nr:MAG TPA: hypothetical protein [Caudoviricetes sp.]
MIEIRYFHSENLSLICILLNNILLVHRIYTIL